MDGLSIYRLSSSRDMRRIDFGLWMNLRVSCPGLDQITLDGDGIKVSAVSCEPAAFIT